MTDADLVAAGGKGAQLLRLRAEAFNVPPFGVVPADAVDAWLARTGAGTAIRAAVAGITADDADAAAAAVHAAITSASVDEPLAGVIERARQAAGDGPVAVRSSAIGEDGADHSFAGQGSSFLQVRTPDDVTRRVLDCIASAWSPRAITYRLLHRLPIDDIQTAVVIQQMVASDVAGVLFTVNPVSGRSDELVVSAVHGLGETLVSGAVDADNVTLARDGGAVLHTSIGAKEQRLDASTGGGATLASTSAEEQATLSLTAEQLAQLHRVGLRIERRFGGTPQDIEWAFAGGKLFVLQARPVTGWTEPLDGELRIWDNANIVENFGDVTAPLTFSFAVHTYGRVYRDYCQVLGVPEQHLVDIEPHTSRLLGSFDGRVYYDVLSWYQVLSLIPGSSVQRKVLAATVGVRETDEALAKAQRPFAHLGRRTERSLHRRTALGFTYRFLTTQRTIDRFMADFEEVAWVFDQLDLEGLDAATIWRRYERLEEQMLDHWGPTAVMDAVISLSVGVLFGLTQAWLPDAPDWFLWQAVKVDDAGLESALPVDRLKALAARVRDDEPLAKLLTTTDAAELPTVLEASDLPGSSWLLGELGRYVEDFGDRSVNELKLEEPDLRDEPAIAWSMLQSAVASPAGTSAATVAAQDADAWLDGRLSGPKRRIYDLVRRKVQHTLRSRERVRFARSRAFGMARRLLRSVAAELVREGALDQIDDVFFLELGELRAVFGGELDRTALRGIVAERRTQIAAQRELDGPPPRFITRGNPAKAAREPDPDPDAATAGEDGVLRGRPSCPGVVDGEARVVDEPRDVGGAILVAYRTDPGWVGALSSASALVIERGSPLTHVAVVARELGIPTVVQVPGVTEVVSDGERIRVDGAAGTVELLERAPATTEEVTA